nr:hypothetical protein [Hydrococcus rivularis]
MHLPIHDALDCNEYIQHDEQNLARLEFDAPKIGVAKLPTSKCKKAIALPIVNLLLSKQRQRINAAKLFLG